MQIFWGGVCGKRVGWGGPTNFAIISTKSQNSEGVGIQLGWENWNPIPSPKIGHHLHSNTYIAILALQLLSCIACTHPRLVACFMESSYSSSATVELHCLHSPMFGGVLYGVTGSFDSMAN